MSNIRTTAKQRWLVPEVVQTSAMDCGPASLKCLLEGFNVPISYGRLREACQTDVDGTSIDMLEVVANQLGVEAEQVMIPVDHVLLPEADVLPAMVVVRHADGATHFVVIWRRHGSWLQVMDPAIGRRWVNCQRVTEEIYRHVLPVPAIDWRDWAATNEFLKPLRQRLSLLGATKNNTTILIDHALKDPGWLALAKLDASVRLVNSIVEADGIKSGKHAVKLVRTLLEQAGNKSDELFKTIPKSYWSVTPQKPEGASEEQLLFKGAVLLQIRGKKSGIIKEESDKEEPLSLELAAALNEKPLHPGKTLLDLLKNDGLLSPVALIGALSISVGAVLIETLLFRGIFDISWELNLTSQRLGAVLGLISFVALLLLIEIPIAMESLRYGRHLEIRLRMALLRKLPNLTDRYFQSRPVSDMAERSHSIHLTRLVPGLGIQFIQTIWDITFTLAGIMLIDSASSVLALIIAALAVGLPLFAQPLLNEMDLRVRSHSGALFTFYLDALLGLVPIRTHRAEQAVSREHEGLLVEWARSSRSLIRISLFTEGLQSLICVGFVGLMLFQHFLRSGGVTGGDLLLVYWALKLPALGQRLTALAHQYPAQRNILLRLLEPLSAPEEIHDPAHNEIIKASTKSACGVGIAIDSGSVLVSGHTILQDIDLIISPGEHVAIVGPSGAGKSSLVGLLLGWHRLATGQLLVDGMTLNGANQQSLRQETAWVDPAIQIWNRSFLDNLNYSSSENGFDKMAGAIDSAALRGVLEKLPSGLQTYLGESGALLSGGEGQRMRLGRALLQTNVRLALLDEPFRGMDRSQRHQLLTDARQWWQDATLLCVTHDVSETLAFNRVLVVENGRIIEDGSPGQLAKSQSRYRDLLDAEEVVRQDLWKGDQWRRIHIQEGCINTTHTDTVNEQGY
ncbi:MAG: ATP-binding cassette domain-containing protein [Methylococcales bacterium]|nr:ATP-binding cassette domain-containing protein [Methylococcales bacterium]